MGPWEGQDALNYSIGASIEDSFRMPPPPPPGGVDSEQGGVGGPEPSSIGVPESVSLSVPERLTQYQLKESGPVDGDWEGGEGGEAGGGGGGRGGGGGAGAAASGEAMLAAARGASAAAVGRDRPTHLTQPASFAHTTRQGLK